jgi:pimeloyl-ACP methyl ester carboxylesterase
MQTHKHKLSDGRLITYETYGDPKGTPIIFSHGLSDSRCLRHFNDELTSSLGILLITVDQPGVGGSSPVPLKHRTLINYARDIKDLADALGLDKFTVAGHSGGGPHALAIAAFMPERVTKCALAAPMPPLCIDGMVDLFPFPMFGLILRLCRWFSLVIYALCNCIAWWANRDIKKYIDMIAVSDRTSGNPDTFLSEPKQTQLFIDNFQQGLLQGGIGIQDMIKVAMIDKSWGFNWRVKQPVTIFACEEDPAITKDTLQLFCDRLPNATSKSWPKAGHYSFVDPGPWKSFLSELK